MHNRQVRKREIDRRGRGGADKNNNERIISGNYAERGYGYKKEGDNINRDETSDKQKVNKKRDLKKGSYASVQ